MITSFCNKCRYQAMMHGVCCKCGYSPSRLRRVMGFIGSVLAIALIFVWILLL